MRRLFRAMSHNASMKGAKAGPDEPGPLQEALR